jgi:hypothetical protein
VVPCSATQMPSGSSMLPEKAMKMQCTWCSALRTYSDVVLTSLSGCSRGSRWRGRLPRRWLPGWGWRPTSVSRPRPDCGGSGLSPKLQLAHGKAATSWWRGSRVERKETRISVSRPRPDCEKGGGLNANPNIARREGCGLLVEEVE